MVKSAAPVRGFIAYGALRQAIQSAAREPLALTIQDIANGSPTGEAAVACQGTERTHGVIVAARPIA
ncbi:MAG: hypothetical protein ACLQOO_04275 [Terriglobia bacterium]